jgi:hypothetical protein
VRLKRTKRLLLGHCLDHRPFLRRILLAHQAAEKRLAMRLQFSIRWILAVTAVVGVALAALSAEPRWISSIVIQMIFLLMPGMAVALLVAGRGYARAFAIGAVVPTLIGVPIVVSYSVIRGLELVGYLGSPYELAEYLFGGPAGVMRVLALFLWSATLLGALPP